MSALAPPSFAEDGASAGDASFGPMVLRALSAAKAEDGAREGGVEVEARFHVAVEALEALEACGLDFSEPVVQDDQAYAPAHWTWGDDRIGVPFARLRTERGQHLFTVKRPITDVRTCLERECLVDDREAMDGALRLMGFVPTVRIVKSRRTATAGELSFCYDELQGVGTFVEIEAIVSEDDDLERARQELEGLLVRLGISARPCTLSYDTLVYEASLDLPAAA